MSYLYQAMKNVGLLIVYRLLLRTGKPQWGLLTAFPSPGWTSTTSSTCLRRRGLRELQLSEHLCGLLWTHSSSSKFFLCCFIILFERQQNSCLKGRKLLPRVTSLPRFSSSKKKLAGNLLDTLHSKPVLLQVRRFTFISIPGMACFKAFLIACSLLSL